MLRWSHPVMSFIVGKHNHDSADCKVHSLVKYLPSMALQAANLVTTFPIQAA